MLGNFKRYFFLLLFISSINPFVEKPELIGLLDLKFQYYDPHIDRINFFDAVVDYYIPENLHKVDVYNKYVNRLQAEGRQHIKNIQNDTTIPEVDKAKKIALLEDKIKVDVRKKHIPLYSFIDPDSKDAYLKSKLSACLLEYAAKGQFVTCTTTNVIRNALSSKSGGISGFFNRLFGFEKELKAEDIRKNNRLLFFKNADIVMIVPRFFFESYDLDKVLQQHEDRTDVLKNNKTFLQFVSQNKSKEINETESNALFIQNYISIFKQETKEYIWDIFIVGHGNTDVTIAGLKKEHFADLLRQLSDTISIGTVFVQSCHVGGSNAVWLEKALQEKPLSYHLVLGLIGEIPFAMAVPLIKKFINVSFAYIHNFFRNAAQLQALDISYNRHELPLIQEKKQEQHFFEKLILSMLNNGFIPFSTPHKSEFLPQFMLKGGSHFENLYDVPGYLFIRSDMENSSDIIIKSGIHTVVFMVPYVEKVTIFAASESSQSYPTFVTMGQAMQELVIAELYLKDDPDKRADVDIENFLSNFKNDWFKSTITIKTLHFKNRIFTDVVLNNDVKVDSSSPLLFRKIISGSFMAKEQKYDFILTNMHFMIIKNIIVPKFIKIPIYALSQNIVFQLFLNINKINKKIEQLITEKDIIAELKDNIFKELFRLLRRFGKSIHIKDDVGNTLLHFLCQNGLYTELESIKFKFEKEAFLEKNNHGKIPLDIAKEYSEKATSVEGKKFYGNVKALYDKIFKNNFSKEKEKMQNDN